MSGVWWHKSFLSPLSWLLHPPPVALLHCLPQPHVITFVLYSQPCGPKHCTLRLIREYYLTLGGQHSSTSRRLLPTVHFFLWVPQVHFGCSSSTAGYLMWPVPPQQCTRCISFKVLQSQVSADMNCIVLIVCPACLIWLMFSHCIVWV